MKNKQKKFLIIFFIKNMIIMGGYISIQYYLGKAISNFKDIDMNYNYEIKFKME